MINKNFLQKNLDKLRFFGLVSDQISDNEILSLYEKIDKEKEEKEKITDSLIDYNDEIVEIILVGEKETIDITVTGDNLFYCNDILTKNSYGINFCLDFLLAGYTSDELKKLKQIGCVQLKNRYRNAQKDEYFTIGFDYEYMRYFDIDNNPDSPPIMDNTKMGEIIPLQKKKKSKFEFDEIK